MSIMIISGQDMGTLTDESVNLIARALDYYSKHPDVSEHTQTILSDLRKTFSFKGENVSVKPQYSNAQQLKAYREKMGYTQVQLAGVLHLSSSSGGFIISALERDMRRFDSEAWCYNPHEMRPLRETLNRYCPGWDKTL